MQRFNLIRRKIKEIISKSPLVFESVHSELTLKWVIKLKPDADEALKIAALCHDIERAITGISEKDLKDYSNINKFKKEHAARSAKITCDLLKKYDYNEKVIKKVKSLIEKHEEGGNEEETILMEADSLAFFDYNIDFYLERYGEEKTKEKIKFMYKRLPKKTKKLVESINFKNKKISNLFKEVK